MCGAKRTKKKRGGLWGRGAGGGCVPKENNSRHDFLRYFSNTAIRSQVGEDS